MIDIDPKRIEDIILHVAATEVMPRFKNLAAGEVREKGPGDFVTVADEASERVFTQLLSEALPGSLVVGEEAVSKDASVLCKFEEDKPVWVIDPIDGTYNFSHGRSKFGILIALVRNGVTEYGWAFDAPGNRMAFAKRGGGTFLDGKKINLSCGKKDMREMVMQGGGAQAWHFDPVRPLVRDVVNVRCSLHDFMSVLAGEADFIVHVNKVTPWDHAAGVLLAQEAGLHVTVDEGKAYNPAQYGPAFMMVTPTREWWNVLYPVMSEGLSRKKQSA